VLIIKQPAYLGSFPDVSGRPPLFPHVGMFELVMFAINSLISSPPASPIRDLGLMDAVRLAWDQLTGELYGPLSYVPILCRLAATLLAAPFAICIALDVIAYTIARTLHLSMSPLRVPRSPLSMQTAPPEVSTFDVDPEPLVHHDAQGARSLLLQDDERGDVLLWRTVEKEQASHEMSFHDLNLA